MTTSKNTIPAEANVLAGSVPLAPESPAPRAPAGGRIVVLKFGGSVLRREEDLPGAVHEIYRHLREGWKVVAVVSAIEGTTDRLLGKARGLSGSPDPAGVAALLATGEATSAALLALELGKAGVPSAVFDAARAGLRTAGSILDSEPVALDADAFHAALERVPVAVLSGFVGVAADGGPSLLGRGGSDYTALFVARGLGARCRLLKDVDGLFERDPATDPSARRHRTISWDGALALESGVVQEKALEFARRNGIAFEVAALQSVGGTWVGSADPAFAESAAPAAPVRVAMLGLGTVGLGVYKRLAAQPGRFEVVAALVRNPSKDRGEPVPASILRTDPAAVLSTPCDLVVEALGGFEPASSLIEEALSRGVDVVTANKEVVARRGAEFEALAASRGARFLFSACVGGSVPVIENVEALTRGGKILAIEGVLNGTTNYVLERLEAGAGLDQAVREAQEKGFAEPDPSADLDGTDAARKLAILARAAFRTEAGLQGVEQSGIDTLDPAEPRKARKTRRVIKLVARCERTPEGVRASVEPRALPEGHPLAGARGEENRVVIEFEGGEACVLSGKGAGRWPTSESVLGDVLEIARCRCGAVALLCVE